MSDGGRGRRAGTARKITAASTGDFDCGAHIVAIYAIFSDVWYLERLTIDEVTFRSLEVISNVAIR